jgi:hypothetical protein
MVEEIKMLLKEESVEKAEAENEWALKQLHPPLRSTPRLL